MYRRFRPCPVSACDLSRKSLSDCVKPLIIYLVSNGSVGIRYSGDGHLAEDESIYLVKQRACGGRKQSYGATSAR